MSREYVCFFFNDTATTDIYTDGHTLSLHDALPISHGSAPAGDAVSSMIAAPNAIIGRPSGLEASLNIPLQRARSSGRGRPRARSEEHTSELQSLMRNSYAVFCLKKKTTKSINTALLIKIIQKLRFINHFNQQ